MFVSGQYRGNDENGREEESRKAHWNIEAETDCNCNFLNTTPQQARETFPSMFVACPNYVKDLTDRLSGSCGDDSIWQ